MQKLIILICTIFLLTISSTLATNNIIYNFTFEDANHINNWTLYGNQGQAKSDSTAQAYTGTHSMFITGGGPTNGVYNTLMANITNGCIEYQIYIPTGGDYGQKMGLKESIATQGFNDLTGISSYWQDDVYWTWRLDGILYDDNLASINHDGWQKQALCVNSSGVFGFVNDTLIYSNSTPYTNFTDYFVFVDNFDGGSAGMYVDDIIGYEITELIPSPPPILEVNWSTLTPLSGFRMTDYTELYYNITYGADSCSLYEDDVNINTTTSLSEGLNDFAYQPPLGVSVSNDYYVSCLNSSMNSTNSTLKSFIIDTMTPVISIGNPQEDNLTVVDLSLTLNITISDTYINETMINISFAGITQWSKYNIGIQPNTSFTYDDIIDVGGWTSGTYLLEVSGGDI